MSLPVSRREFMQVSAASMVAAPLLTSAAPAESKAGSTTAAQYIIQRLHEQGVGFLFGVPGATCDPLFAAAQGSPLRVVVTSSDLEAGYAADGCARVKGLSAVAVTYGVGTLSMISVVAGAYAERSPMVIINGGPSAEDLRIQRELGSYFSHSTGKDKTDLTMFREVTEYAERAERASDVPGVVDNAIRAALTRKRPVYIEIPKHLWDAACPAPSGRIDTSSSPSGNEATLAADIIAKLRAASKPVVLLDIELQRYGLEKEAAALVGKLGIPWTTTLLAKSVIPEQTAGFAGVYGGERAIQPVKNLVENADVVFALGCVMGRQLRKLVTGNVNGLINASNDTVRIGRASPVRATLGRLLAALMEQEWTPPPSTSALKGLSFDERRTGLKAAPASSEPGMTYDEALRQVSGFLDENFIAVTDTSLSMYPAAELNIAGQGGFVCNAVWQAIGFSVGAAVGIGLAQKRRPVVVCGDGGFQMTAQSLSTMARHRMRSVVIVLDNGHYGIEQWLLDPSYFASAGNAPRPYLGLNAWDYAGLAKAMGIAASSTVSTESELQRALKDARDAQGPVFIAARIKPHDLPAQLRT